jgi:hypothetical protein
MMSGRRPRASRAGSGPNGKSKDHQLEEMIAGSDTLTATKRADAAAIKAGENLDGKYQLRISDPKLSGEDIALGYKQVLQVERGWRDLKQVIDLRPACHRKEERIRAHVILCWPAVLLIRIAATTTGTAWATIADQARPAHPWHLHRPGGHLPADRRAHQDPARPARQGQRFRTPRRSSRPPPRPPDQQRTRPPVTRPVTIPAWVRAGQTTDPGTMAHSHLRNPGTR